MFLFWQRNFIKGLSKLILILHVNKANCYLNEHVICTLFSLAFDTPQQVKSVIPKHFLKQNGDQNSDHVVISQWLVMEWRYTPKHQD